MRFAPEKTAINRMDRDGNPKMTMPTRFLLEKGQPELFQRMESCRRVLDFGAGKSFDAQLLVCLLYTSPSPRDRSLSRMPSSA